MAKLTLNSVLSGFLSVVGYNTNNARIEAALENTLSRDGTAPNQMAANLDMNGYRILNALADSGDGFIWMGAWVTATSYALNNLVSYNGSSYICKVTHTSGVFGTDLSSVYWEVLSAKGDSGAGTGDMLKTENLSGLADIALARANILAAKSGVNTDITELTATLNGNATTSTTATDTAVKTGTGSTYVTNQGPTINSPVLVTPALGTPTSGVLTNCTGYPSVYTLGAEVTLSGTSTNLIATIPSNATKIYVMINGMSTNNSVDYILQFGDAGGYETSGYISTADSNAGLANSTSGFIITGGAINAHVHYGVIEFMLQKSSTFTWVSQGMLVLGGGSVVHKSAGIKSTSQALTSIRITTTTGAPTFDAGTVSVAYET